MKKVQKLREVQKVRQLSRSCQEGLPEGPSRAGEGEGPGAGRKRARRFTDGTDVNGAPSELEREIERCQVGQHWPSINGHYAGLFDGEGRGLIEPGSIKVALETGPFLYEKVLGIAGGCRSDLGRKVAGSAGLLFIVLRDM